MSSTITISAFSKLVGDKPQSVHMGIITAAGSVGRILFPLLADVIPTNAVVAIAGVLAVGCGGGILCFDKVAHVLRGMH